MILLFVLLIFLAIAAGVASVLTLILGISFGWVLFIIADIVVFFGILKLFRKKK